MRHTLLPGLFLVLGCASSGTTNDDGARDDAGIVVADSSNGDVVTHAAEDAGSDGSPVQPPFYTSGGTIEDAHGQPLRLLGLDMSPLDTTEDAPAAANISKWGFNFVRVVVYWEEFEPTAPSGDPLVHHWDDAGYLTKIAGEVDALTKKGLAVVLDMHQVRWSSAIGGDGMPAWLYPDHTNLTNGQAKCAFFSNVGQPGVPLLPQDAFAAAWQHLLSAYVTNPLVVGADILNEPTGDASTCTSPSYHPDLFYSSLGTTIRKMAPDILLMVEDNAYESYLSSGKFFLPDTFAATMQSAGLSSWVYSWHLYPNPFSSGQVDLDAHVARAASWGVPLWIGEFNPKVGSPDGGAEIPNPDWQTDLPTMMTYFRKHDVSWSLWQYEASGEFGLVNSMTGDPDPTLLSGLQNGW